MKTLPPLPEKTFRFKRSVAFADTDAAGMAHFTSLLRYVEDAEHEALRSVDLPVFSREGGWPRVHFDIDFLQPFKFEELLEIDIWVAEIGKSSLVWNFQIKKVHADTAGAFGRMGTVHVGAEGKSLPFSSQERKALSLLESH